MICASLDRSNFRKSSPKLPAPAWTTETDIYEWLWDTMSPENITLMNLSYRCSFQGLIIENTCRNHTWYGTIIHMGITASPSTHISDEIWGKLP